MDIAKTYPPLATRLQDKGIVPLFEPFTSPWYPIRRTLRWPWRVSEHRFPALESIL